jgi:branched-subunit amino acid transport protein AzlD
MSARPTNLALCFQQLGVSQGEADFNHVVTFHYATNLLLGAIAFMLSVTLGNMAAFSPTVHK